MVGVPVVVPSTLVLEISCVAIEAFGLEPACWAWYMLICRRSERRFWAIELCLASAPDSVNWGITAAARIAKMTTTIRISTSVKPECLTRFIASPVHQSHKGFIGRRTPAVKWRGYNEKRAWGLLPQAHLSVSTGPTTPANR